ncbi:MAG: hypothetical protein K2G55_16065 [Lachnospiraceae bacterium]|nr:hypothetical protein [Lachnospiraceae bacterium]
MEERYAECALLDGRFTYIYDMYVSFIGGTSWAIQAADQTYDRRAFDAAAGG